MFVHVAPVADDMTVQEFCGRLFTALQRIQGTWSRDDCPETESRCSDDNLPGQRETLTELLSLGSARIATEFQHWPIHIHRCVERKRRLWLSRWLPEAGSTGFPRGAAEARTGQGLGRAAKVASAGNLVYTQH